jgi:hypothetical protein
MSVFMAQTSAFCHNEADPDQGIGNHCVCANGATLGVIPWTGGNVSDYQPCAYTTVDATPTSTGTATGGWTTWTGSFATGALTARAGRQKEV